MSSIASPRRQYYIDPDLQLPVVASLTLLVTTEAFFVGYGFYKAIGIAREWQRPHQVFDFFGTLFVVLALVCALNLAFGVLLSHRIAGPALKLRRAMEELARGDLAVRVALRRGDLLQPLAAAFNLMAASLRARSRGFGPRRAGRKRAARLSDPRLPRVRATA